MFSRMLETHVEVLVIGAGPTGLFTAAELARHGVRPRIIDKCPAPHTQTRATGIQPAALEVLHRAGLAERFLAESVPVRGLRVFDHRMEEAFVTGEPAKGTPFPYTCSIPQWRTEEILYAHLLGLGVEVERGVTAETIDLDEDGVRVECRGPDGQAFSIRADYLVGAGGAHSPVRGALHEHLDGITYPRRYLVADAAVAGVSHDGDRLAVAISPQGMVMVAKLPEGRSLVLTNVPDDAVFGDTPGLEDVRGALGRHLERPFSVEEVRWASVYRTHRRMSPRFADGRCFLAGDAAHLCSPLGGEGMNSGFLDAASLAWMLGAVLRRGGRAGLLAAYEPERQQIARQVLASSEAMHDFYFGLAERAAAGQPLMPPFDPTREVSSPAMLDLALSESPLLGFHGTALGVQALRPGRRFPACTRLGGCTHHLLVYGGAPGWDRSGFSARWGSCLTVVVGEDICPPEQSGVSASGAVLVRPDGYIGFLAEAWDSGAQAAFARLFSAQFTGREEDPAAG